MLYIVHIIAYFMKFVSILLFTILLVFPGCIKTELNTGSHNETNSDLIIKAGFECGWGSGTDSLEISQKTINYVYYVPASSSEPIVRKSRSLKDDEWKEILSDVNTDDFAELSYNDCNICYDGCDEWIFIEKGTFSHKITFGKGLAIDTISNLQKKLAELRAEFNP